MGIAPAQTNVRQTKGIQINFFFIIPQIKNISASAASKLITAPNIGVRLPTLSRDKAIKSHIAAIKPRKAMPMVHRIFMIIFAIFTFIPPFVYMIQNFYIFVNCITLKNRAAITALFLSIQLFSYPFSDCWGSPYWNR